MSEKFFLLPKPKEISITEGRFPVSYGFVTGYDIPKEIENGVNIVLGKDYKTYSINKTRNVNLAFTIDEVLPEQGYRLAIDQDGIHITYSRPQGAFYALITLKHLRFQYGESLPYISIFDYPDIENRGVFQDISRNKIPTMKSLFQYIDLLADLKFNQLQFYIEGFSFGYPSFPEYWKNETPVTSEEFAELDAYCRERYIDLIPNQNSLGHMTEWLALDEFAGLAECPDGFVNFGMPSPPSTLDPCDEGSLDLVKKMMDDLLPNFTSDLYNACLDEPFELGKGKNFEKAEKEGAGNLYVEFVKKIHALAACRGKRIIMAGDFVALHPELISQLPKDIIIDYWGYEDITPFDLHADNLSKSGHDFYLVCGTSTSLSVAGKTDNMLKNIEDAVCASVRYQANGVWIGDFGDGGHWHSPAASYTGFVYCAALSWNSKNCTKDDVCSYLDYFVFRDDSRKMTNAVMDLGNYYKYEDVRYGNMTSTIIGLQLGIVPKPVYYMMTDSILNGIKDFGDKMLGTELPDDYLPEHRKEYDYKGIIDLLDDIKKRIDGFDLNCPDDDLYKNELRNSIELIRIGANVRHFIDTSEEMDTEIRKEFCLKLADEITETIDQFCELWRQRNREGGLSKSVKILIDIREQLIREAG